MESLVNFIKNHNNLTFSVLGIVIFITLLGSLIWGIDFALRTVNQAFENSNSPSSAVTHFNFKGYANLGFPTSTQ